MLAILPFLTMPALPQAGAAPATPITLARVFKAGETATYRVTGNLVAERKSFELETALPQDIDLAYEFTYKVTALKADGIAHMEYRRPSFKVVYGESASSPEKVFNQKMAETLVMDVSPLNEILDLKIVKPKKSLGLPYGARQGLPIGEFIQEVQRLALFAGPPQSALDFNPRFPLDKVKPGDTWQRTVGYSPQKLAGSDKKQAVQRLDYTYRYDGMVTLNNVKYRRVTATLKLDTDLVEFLHQTYGVTGEETGLAKIPLKLDATIQFNLDPATNRTVSAFATSKGGFDVFVRGSDRSVQGEILSGKSRMLLLPPSKPTKRK